MQRRNRWMFVAAILAMAPLSACRQDSGAHEKIEPAHVEHIEGSALSRVTLTEKAMERVGEALTAAISERFDG